MRLEFTSRLVSAAEHRVGLHIGAHALSLQSTDIDGLIRHIKDALRIELEQACLHWVVVNARNPACCLDHIRIVCARVKRVERRLLQGGVAVQRIVHLRTMQVNDDLDLKWTNTLLSDAVLHLLR